MVFKIDKISQTASLFKVIQNIEQIIIQRTVRHNSKEYLITSIKVKILKFVEDSAITTIYGEIFPYLWSAIEEIHFPTSLNNLKEGWCSYTTKLTKIIISPLNGQFIFKKRPK